MPPLMLPEHTHVIEGNCSAVRADIEQALENREVLLNQRSSLTPTTFFHKQLRQRGPNDGNRRIVSVTCADLDRDCLPSHLLCSGGLVEPGIYRRQVPEHIGVIDI